MAIYLIHNNETYPLYPNTMYTLGKEKTVDIFLPIEQQVLQVEEQQVILNEVTYDTWVHHIRLSEDVHIRLLILKEAQYFLLPNTKLYISSDDSAQLKVINSDIEAVLVFKRRRHFVYEYTELLFKWSEKKVNHWSLKNMM